MEMHQSEKWCWIGTVVSRTLMGIKEELFWFVHFGPLWCILGIVRHYQLFRSVSGVYTLTSIRREKLFSIIKVVSPLFRYLKTITFQCNVKKSNVSYWLIWSIAGHICCIIECKYILAYKQAFLIWFSYLRGNSLLEKLLQASKQSLFINAGQGFRQLYSWYGPAAFAPRLIF